VTVRRFPGATGDEDDVEGHRGRGVRIPGVDEEADGFAKRGPDDMPHGEKAR
jgi:hypothetical protein